MNQTRYFRKFVDILTIWLGRLRKKQRIKVSGIVKVNLGCGLSVAPGWLNIDGSINALVANLPGWSQILAYRLTGARQFYTQDYYLQTLRQNRFVHHDLSYSIPLANGTTDFVYSSHFLEHLDRVTAKRLLAESLRVLKPAGIIRIGVPDLAYAWEMYKRGDKERMLHDYFFIDGATGYSQHRYLYDFELLAAVLSQVGFVNIRRVAFQQGATPDIDLLDNRADYTLFVEADKPAT